MMVLAGHWPLITDHSVVWAEVPQTIHYQGRLSETDDSPIVGEHTITMRLYDAPAGGAQLWEEAHTVTITKADRGLVALELGSIVPFAERVTFQDPVWLTLEIDGSGELLPRQALTASGYALNADKLDGFDAQQIIGAALSGHTGGGPPPAIQPGDIEAGDLPPHAALHQPGGADALPTAGAVSIGSANSAGASTSVARADHGHQGVHAIAASGQPPLVGDIVVAAGANVSLSQAGNTLTITASPGTGGAGAKATASGSNAVTLATASDTDLLSVSLTTSRPGSTVLVVASVQLNHLSAPNNKTVDLRLVLDGALVDGSYTVRLGTAAETTRNLPVTIHAAATPSSGPHTIVLRAKASGTGAQATLRRLTALELP